MRSEGTQSQVLVFECASMLLMLTYNLFNSLHASMPACLSLVGSDKCVDL
jgi:hypothetical protein